MSTHISSLKAYRIFSSDGNVQGRFVTMDLNELDPGDVVVKVAFSSVNFKDALAATGAGRIIRRFPCVGGIDLSGTVVRSAAPGFREGDEVIATGYDLGVAHDGGYAEYCRVPAGWVVPLPAGLSLWDAMALGTAGYTAGLALTRMEHEGLAPQNGPVIVSGATGGVGSLAVDMLATRGYAVTALTGKAEQSDYLKRLGAGDVLLSNAIDPAGIKPLDHATWAGAVDNVGGPVFSWMMSRMRPNGALASIGMAASFAVQTTVMPLILRGVSVLGINSADTPMPLREKVWQRLTSELKPRHLAETVRTVPFGRLAETFEPLIAGRNVGRVVVAIA